jgi:hypothetical protein
VCFQGWFQLGFEFAGWVSSSPDVCVVVRMCRAFVLVVGLQTCRLSFEPLCVFVDGFGWVLKLAGWASISPACVFLLMNGAFA